MPKYIRCQIKGRSPLLMHKFSADALETVARGGARSANPARKKPSRREEARRAAYWGSNGNLCFLGPNFFSAVVAAGKYHKIGTSKVTNGRTSMVPGALQVVTIEADLGTKDFEVDSRRVLNPSNGRAAICHRARLDAWQCTFILEIDEDIFDESFIRTLVDDAGKRIGLGAFRIERKGPFGRFCVQCWSEVDEDTVFPS